MNKRAKKRVKQAIEKENLEKAQARKGQHTTSKGVPQRRGFTPRPDKKRG